MLLPTLTLALLATLALGFWVFAAAPGRRENQIFAAFTWLTSLWVANDLHFWGFHGPDADGMPWARAAFAIALALQLAFLAFAWVFPRPRPVPKGRLALVLAPAAVFVPVILWGQPLAAVGFVDGQFQLALSPWTFALGAYVYGLFLLGRVIVIARRRAEETDPRLRRQLGLVLVSPNVTGAITTLAVVALPLLGVYDLLPYTSLGILLGAMIHSYAALNQRFLRPASALDDLRLFPVGAKLALAVALFWVASVGLALGAVQWTTARDPSPQGWQQAWLFALVASFVPAMGLILAARRIVATPLRKIGEAAVEVGKGRTDVRVELGSDGRDDEVSVLAATFNDMLTRLEADLATQRETNQTLLRTERLAVAGSLAAGVAHEVNNPLAAISSLVQTAQGKTDDPKAKALLEDALGLLDFARVPGEPDRRPCELGPVVEKTLALLRYDKRFRAVELKTELAASPAVQADPAQLQQVVMNLVLNARDAIEARRADEPGAPAAITVSVAGADARADASAEAATGPAAELRVSDTGCGIPAELRERLFEPFFTTKPPGSGTGLGLAVCRDLVRRHDGRIDVESEPGQGTTVVVRLPALEVARG
jgi:signal transduction histidine kinase